MRPLAAPLSLVAMILAGCASARPDAGASAPPAVAACEDSRGADCDNGMPLCMMDEERACQMCHCSAYALAAPPLNAGTTQQPPERSASHPMFSPITVR